MPRDQLAVPVAVLKAPSTATSTRETATLSEALPETVMVPATVAPDAGDAMATAGAVVSVVQFFLHGGAADAAAALNDSERANRTLVTAPTAAPRMPRTTVIVPFPRSTASEEGPGGS